MSSAVSWAIWTNMFFGAGILIWLRTGHAEYGFGIIAIGLLLQYFYDDWGKWVWKLLK